MASKMAQYDILPENTYNMDEKGFLIGVLQKTKRVFSKGTEIRGTGQDGNREWITVVATISMDGSYLPPSIIYQAKTDNIQDSWLEDFNNQEAYFTSSPTGWTNDSLGISWLTEVFDRHTKGKARNGRDYRLLLVDGHGSHLNMPFLDWCDQHKIIVAVYPPHSTHRLQPLDVSLFSPLANYYSQQLNQWIHDTQGLCKLNKRHFFGLFWPAYLQAFSPKNIASGWSKTGLLPFNPEQVLSKLQERRSTKRDSSGSLSSTALSDNDWIKVRRLVKSAVGDVIGPEVRKLSNTLEQLAAKNSILEAENQGLRRAVFIEKKKRTRAKPLFDALRDDSKSLWFSPTKIQQARELVVVKEDEKAKLAEQKMMEKEERQIQKEAKAAEVAQRKVERQQAQFQKAQALKEKKAAKEEARLAKQAVQQIQIGLKEQAKGYKKKIPAIPIQEDVVVIENSTAKEEVMEIEKGRLGRPRKLPIRFQ